MLRGLLANLKVVVAEANVSADRRARGVCARLGLLVMSDASRECETNGQAMVGGVRFLYTPAGRLVGRGMVEDDLAVPKKGSRSVQRGSVRTLHGRVLWYMTVDQGQGGGTGILGTWVTWGCVTTFGLGSTGGVM